MDTAALIPPREGHNTPTGDVDIGDVHIGDPVIGRTSDAAAVSKKRNFSALAESAWIWSVVGYTVVRFLVAWGAFSEHGANVWIFGLLDVGTAWPYAKAIAIVCRRAAASQWSKLPVPVTVALVSFFLPYAYLWMAAGAMPSGVRFGFAIFVTVVLLAATAGVMSKTRKMRSAEGGLLDLSTEDADAASPETVIAVATVETVADISNVGEPQTTEMLIDLTGDEVKVERRGSQRLTA